MKVMITLGLVFSSLFVTKAVAESCGVIDTRMLYLQPNEFAIALNHPIDKKDWSVRTAALTPGKHKLSAHIVGQGNRSNTAMTIHMGDTKRPSSVIVFELDVKADTTYRIVAKKDRTENAPSEYRIEIKSEKQRECNKKPLYRLDVLTESMTELPRSLQYRLDLVTREVVDYVKKSGFTGNNFTLSQDSRMTKNLGLIVNSKATGDNGLNIVAISPSSLAERIGLRAGDYIYEINDVVLAKIDEESRAINIFKNRLYSMQPGDELVMEVVRKGKAITLTSKFSDLELPAYKLNLSFK